ncbi:thiol reductant ABC exporter subunit CydD [Aeromicrobium sp. 50.2.37]|uniref:thiol reductant ABC exporter subunit CydD n=1 Tax=Aeromicrobium sp. 50.2.37 TaxID=2969305 RepID=UPI0021502FD8|nr:thiol reductant ABC exporter subunit CydD [Aeromicrobium sp. 50.2.37]MCR4512393.1 thiol reductant ABC exporter subunit CydD [Aeromicrobium sp. 50.2.37]
MGPVDPRLLRRSRPARRFLVATVVLGSVAAVAVVAQAWLVSDVVVGLVEGESTRAIATVAGLLAAVVAARGVLAWAQAAAGTRAATSVKAGLRHDLVDAVLDQRRVGAAPSSARVATLLETGLDALDGYVARFLPQVVLTAVVPVAVLLTLAVVDPLSALIVVLTLPLVVTFLVLVGLVTRDRLDHRWGELQRLGRHFSDVLAGLTVLTGFGRDSARGLREVGERHRRATMESLRTAFLSSLVLELFSTLSVALVAVAAGLRLVGGGLDLGTGLLVIVLAPEAYLPLRRLGTQFHDSTQGLAAADEALTLLDGPGPAADLRTGHFVVDGPAPVTVQGLEVVHPGREQPALVLPAFTLLPGDFVAVTGPSGSGKSTLLSVLLGFAAPTAGAVRVGRHRLDELDPEAWRRQVAWVPQDPHLLAGTVADNVRLGDPDADDAQVRAALDDAGADDLSAERHVGEQGQSLSAGERRRVAVARALLRIRTGDAWLLLMDEPTAGLDAHRESTVLGTLCRLQETGDVTVVVVAHRAETVAAASRELRVEVPSTEPATAVPS